jgi:predicted nucleic acid-binding Zn ribbon protein
MPRYINVTCNNCGTKFPKPLKRYNESTKNNWKFYCSAKCLASARTNNVKVTCSTDSRASQSKKKKLKRKKKCLNPACTKSIPNKNKYCSNKCQRQHQKPTRDQSRSKVLKQLHIFAKTHERTPLKKELCSIYRPARDIFGTWNNAIKAAGLAPNPLLFAKRQVAKDGHMCDSMSEKIIDNWLYSKGVPHKINVPYPGQKKLTVDFLIDNIWIEFFGLSGQLHKYDELVDKKLSIAKQKKLLLVKLYPKHLFPQNKLDTVLGFLVD